MIFIPPAGGGGGEGGPPRPVMVALVGLGALALAGVVAYRFVGGDLDLDALTLGGRIPIVGALTVVLGGVAAVVALRKPDTRSAQPRVTDRLAAIEKQLEDMQRQMETRLTDVSRKVEESTRAALAARDRRDR